jgi:hypothetical protein
VHARVVTFVVTLGLDDPPERPETAWLSEADGETRTPDPIITSDVLYQLSYVGASTQSSPRQDSIVTSVPIGV